LEIFWREEDRKSLEMYKETDAQDFFAWPLYRSQTCPEVSHAAFKVAWSRCKIISDKFQMAYRL
jgi:hypothetical protein